MRKRIAWKWWIGLGLIVVIRLVSMFPEAVERYYSHGLYPLISSTQRLLTGWVPSSIGDIVYLLVGVRLFWLLIRLIRRLFLRQMSWVYARQSLSRIMFSVLLVYVVFNLSWGLNYNRVPMMRTMGLDASPYSTEELLRVTKLVVERVNAYDSLGLRKRDSLKRKRYLFGEAVATYGASYRLPSVKPSIFSYAGNYLGFTGYYNPFSGEAQTNTTVPLFIQPFTTCHEIGHQLGYAKENEANFAGFLAARTSRNPAILYSVYFDMLSYTMREIQLRDSTQLIPLREMLSPRVKADVKDLRAFYRRYDNPFEPVIRLMYANYLRANQQPQGMKTYNEVVAMVVGYYRRYNTI